MVNISSRRSVGGTPNRSSRYHLRRIFLTAIIFIFGFYILSLRRFFIVIKNNNGNKSPASQSYIGNGPPPPDQAKNNDASSLAKYPGEIDGEPVAVIAHAISLIKCSKGSSVTGFLDAAAILRHSIHKNSIHYKPTNNNTLAKPPSRYSYKMYGIVHTSCQDHAKVLERLGYEILVRDHPVKKEDIKGEWLRNHIEAENCCGSAEFIKLYGTLLVTLKCMIGVLSIFFCI